MSEKKILYLGMSPNKGGIEKTAVSLFQHIDRNKVQIDFLTSHKKIAYEDIIESLNGKIYRIDFYRGIRGVLKNINIYYKFFKEHPEYEIVHNNLMSYYHIESIIAQKLAKTPTIIIHARGSKLTYISFKITMVQYINKKIALLFSNKYFACSNDAGIFMFNNKILNSKNYKWIKNGIDLDNFKFSLKNRITTRKQLGVNSENIYGHIGAFLPVKNHKFILEIFKEILILQEDAHLLLIGDGVLKDECIKYVGNLGISSHVSFLGSVDNVNDLLCSMDSLIFPSISEGFGNVIIEAQATGLPCYISDNIPNEVNITNLVRSISLSYSAKEWADIIVSSRIVIERDKYNKIVKDKGFDIRDVSTEYQDLYLSNGGED